MFLNVYKILYINSKYVKYDIQRVLIPVLNWHINETGLSGHRVYSLKGKYQFDENTRTKPLSLTGDVSRNQYCLWCLSYDRTIHTNDGILKVTKLIHVDKISYVLCRSDLNRLPTRLELVTLFSWFSFW